MPIEFKRNRVLFLDEVSVDEAEGLLEWLQKRPTAAIDLSACSHMHTADLQVLMAAKARICAWPKNPELRSWIEPVLQFKD